MRQELRPINCEARVQHAIGILDLLEASNRFLSDVFFSDECHFHVHGGVNHQVSCKFSPYHLFLLFQNFRYWSQENPNWYRENPLHSPYLRVWAAIGRRGVIGPYFFDENVTGESYLAMLQQFFLPSLHGTILLKMFLWFNKV